MAGELRLVDVYSGPEFVVRYPDGFAAYVVGVTYQTHDVSGQLTVDGAETVALEWFDAERLTPHINPYNREPLRRAGLGGTDLGTNLTAAERVPG